MTDFQRIIHSDIIKNDQDDYWAELDKILSVLQPKNVLVITLPFDNSNSEQAQLIKMLNACQLNESDYNIVEVDLEKNIAWNKLKDIVKPKSVILIGILPKQLGISALFRLNMTNNFDDITWIPTLSLATLEQQPNAKKDLWVQALKPLFVDKKQV